MKISDEIVCMYENVNIFGNVYIISTLHCNIRDIKIFIHRSTVKPRFWNTSWSAVNVFQNRGLFQNRGPQFGKKIEKCPG